MKCGVPPSCVGGQPDEFVDLEMRPLLLHARRSRAPSAPPASAAAPPPSTARIARPQPIAITEPGARPARPSIAPTGPGQRRQRAGGRRLDHQRRLERQPLGQGGAEFIERDELAHLDAHDPLGPRPSQHPRDRRGRHAELLGDDRPGSFRPRSAAWPRCAACARVSAAIGSGGTGKAHSLQFLSAI